MKKHFLAVLFLLAILIPTLSGCGVKKLSGTFVSDLDKNVYVKFSSESKILFHNESGTIKGTYRISDNLVSASFPDSEENTYMFFEVKDKKTIYQDYTVAFVKKSFWARHWKKIVIGFFAFGIFSILYKKITGRDLEDDLDKL